TSVTINGDPINPDAVYTVTANESVPMIMDLLGIAYSDLKVLPVTEFEALTAYATKQQILVPKIEGRVICGSYMKGFHTVAANTNHGEVTDMTIPAKFALEQNYPNPFNPSTTIRYSVPAAGRVSLKIYNVIGQVVAELVSGEQGAGAHAIVWNAAQMPSGVYLMRLEAAGNVAVRKLQLLK
ncbi:MAG TPA: T9SS type A sorting domain-containing protein, partial [Bacteroidota bacterium]|nr:T9SS type A sorting domain-containing protein [Bacteroidota bacterium]